MEYDWNIIVAGIHATFPSVDIDNVRARDFLNIYLPNINGDTTFGHTIRIMNAKWKDLNEEEKKLRRARTRELNKTNQIRTSEELHKFFKMAFKGKGDKK